MEFSGCDLGTEIGVVHQLQLRQQLHEAILLPTGKFGDKINQGAKKPTLNLENQQINGLDSSKNFIKRFLRRRLGEQVSPNSEIFEFIDHLYRKVSFPRSTSPNAMADGGEFDEPGLAVIQINIEPADDLSTVMQRSEGSILHLRAVLSTVGVFSTFK